MSYGRPARRYSYGCHVGVQIVDADVDGLWIDLGAYFGADPDRYRRVDYGKFAGPVLRQRFRAGQWARIEYAIYLADGREYLVGGWPTPEYGPRLVTGS